MATLTNNGFNLFRIGDKEIESIDYAVIGTIFLNQIFHLHIFMSVYEL
jgi:hypothetical protein